MLDTMITNYSDNCCGKKITTPTIGHLKLCTLAQQSPFKYTMNCECAQSLSHDVIVMIWVPQSVRNNQLGQYYHLVRVTHVMALCKDTINCTEKAMKTQVILTKPNNAFYLYYDRSLLLFSRPMRNKDTSALREMFKYSSLVKKPIDQCEIATH